MVPRVNTSKLFEILRSSLRAGLLTLALIAPAPALAAENDKSSEPGKTGMFEKATLIGTPGAYLAKGNRINVRARPNTKGKRLSRLSRGDKVYVLGLVKGTSWLAVQRDGADLGYIYRSSLIPYLDDVPEVEINGQAAGEGGVMCTYKTRLDERRTIEKSVMVTADYWVDLTCTMGGTTFETAGFLFVTLVPYDLSRRPVYQANFEIAEVGDKYEEALNVVTLYDVRSHTLKLKSVAPKKYASGTPIKSLDAPNSAAVVEGVIRIGFSAWSQLVWQELSSQQD